MHPKARDLLKSFGQMTQFDVSTDLINTGPEPKLQYLIYFTPRSGSSWLTELLTSNPGFGQPAEWFNPDFMLDMATTVGVNNVFDFVSLVRRNFADPETGTFGAELTYFHLEVMRELTDFFAHFPHRRTRIFHLDRRDTVAQAISLYRAVKSGVFHTTDARAGEAPPLPYDAEEIAYWHDHIREQRMGLQRLYEEHGISPIRLNYEDMMELGPAGTLDLFSMVLLGRRFAGTVVEPAANRKLGGAEQDAWADRFRADRPGVG